MFFATKWDLIALTHTHKENGQEGHLNMSTNGSWWSMNSNDDQLKCSNHNAKHKLQIQKQM